MSTYIYGTRFSYRDYLQAKSFEDDLRFEINEQTRSIIASNEELEREHIATIESLPDAVSSGFEQLSVDMQDISSGIAELTSVCQWGFSELILGMGHVNDALDELIKIARTPAQTWAYEQFEIARNAFRQSLYDEAIEYIDRAIYGYGSNTGYKIEYRFHFLLGTIRIGSFKNYSPEIVNPGKAEIAFLAAAKYARHDLPHEAGRAFVAAGWAAYCQGKFTEAQQYTEQAISLYPDLGEAHFQLSKIQMHCGNPTKALPYLKKAICLDRGYAIKALSDDDFKSYGMHVHRLIEELRKESQKIVMSSLKELDKRVSELYNIHVRGYLLTKYANISAAKQGLEGLRHACETAVNNNTYFGYLDALSFCPQVKSNIKNVINEFQNNAIKDLNNKIPKVPTEPVYGNNACGCLLSALGMIISFILGVAVVGSVLFVIIGCVLSFILAQLIIIVYHKNKIGRINREIHRLEEMKKDIENSGGHDT